jgi:ribosomal protein L15
MVRKNTSVKILAKGTLSKKLHFVGIENFSEAARKAVEAVG